MTMMPMDGKDDFDADGDGFIPNQYEGIQTLGVISPVIIRR